MRRKASRRRGALRRAVAAALALAAGAAARPACANEVVVNESVCGQFGCIDGYEVKCKQPARYACVSLDVSPSDDDEGVDFYMNVVETAPAAGLGTGFQLTAGANQTKKVCVKRPWHLSDGLITAVATVGTNTLWSGPKPYRLKAECVSFTTGVKVSKTTTVKKKQDN